MQKLVLGVLALLIPLCARAQEYPIDRGSLLIEGSASYTSSGGSLYEDYDDDRLNVLTINSSVQRFLVPNLAIGTITEVSRVSRGGSSETLLGIGPRVSLFLGTPKGSVQPFISAHALFVSLTAEYEYRGHYGYNTGTERSIATGYVLGVSGGFAVMVARNVALTAAGIYNHEYIGDEFGYGLGNHFGVRFGVAGFIF